MKIGIAGYGYVGQAYEYILKEYHDIIISDPAKGLYGDLHHADAIIICVSTPARSDGRCHMDNVFDVVDAAPDVPILIKSTISVEGWRTIRDSFPNRSLTFSPEFLRAEHWKQDIKNTKQFYLGGEATNFWSDILLQALGNVSISIADPEHLVVSKQLRNSYLALKVSFFNQVYDFCKAKGLVFDDIRRLVCEDERIGNSHSFVTNERGFGGHCFPKDILATIRSAQLDGERLTLLEEALEYNNKVTNEKSRNNI